MPSAAGTQASKMHMLNKTSCHKDVWCSRITAQLILKLSTGWRQAISFILIAAFPSKEKKGPGTRFDRTSVGLQSCFQWCRKKGNTSALSENIPHHKAHN